MKKKTIRITKSQIGELMENHMVDYTTALNFLKSHYTKLKYKVVLPKKGTYIHPTF